MSVQVATRQWNNIGGRALLYNLYLGTYFGVSLWNRLGLKKNRKQAYDDELVYSYWLAWLYQLEFSRALNPVKGVWLNELTE